MISLVDLLSANVSKLKKYIDTGGRNNDEYLLYVLRLPGLVNTKLNLSSSILDMSTNEISAHLQSKKYKELDGITVLYITSLLVDGVKEEFFNYLNGIDAYETLRAMRSTRASYECREYPSYRWKTKDENWESIYANLERVGFDDFMILLKDVMIDATKNNKIEEFVKAKAVSLKKLENGEAFDWVGALIPYGDEESVCFAYEQSSDLYEIAITALTINDKRLITVLRYLEMEDSLVNLFQEFLNAPNKEWCKVVRIISIFESLGNSEVNKLVTKSPILLLKRYRGKWAV